MKLITQAILKRFTEVGRQDKPNAEIVVKYFSIVGNWTWYVTAATFILHDGTTKDAEKFKDNCPNVVDIKDIQFFGLVVGHETELGYFCLSELASLGWRLERDLYFSPTTLDQISR